MSVEHRFVLDVPMDPAPIGPAPGDRRYSLVSWVGPCPDEYLAGLAGLQTQMNEDTPVGELTYTPRTVDVERLRDSDRVMAEQGWTKVRTVAVDATGSACGYTELLVTEHDTHTVVQDDTLVDRGHRGRGLGLRLKLANLQLLQTHDGGALLGPRRRIQTFCEQGNVAMRHVNARLGFREVDTLHHFEGPVGGDRPHGYATWS